MRQHDDESLQRGLSERHVQLIAIGGAIGIGLFLASSSTISFAGPSAIIVSFRRHCYLFYYASCIRRTCC
jgi:L-asparagine transporter-like permease